MGLHWFKPGWFKHTSCHCNVNTEFIISEFLIPYSHEHVNFFFLAMGGGGGDYLALLYSQLLQ